MGVRGIVGCFCLALGALGVAPSPAAAWDGQTLRVGLSPEYPPYEWVDEHGDAQGFCVDLLRAIAEDMQIDSTFLAADWTEVQQKMRAGELDVLAAMFPSEERRRWADFSMPVLEVQYAIFVRKGDETIATLDDLSGRLVLVEGGSLVEQVLQKAGNGDNLVDAGSEPQTLRMLNGGQYAAAVAPLRQGRQLIAAEGLEEIVALDKPAFTRGLSFGVRRGEDRLREALNAGLKKMRSSGRFQAIYNVHFQALPTSAARHQQGPGPLLWLVVFLALGLLVGALMVGRRRRAKNAAETKHRSPTGSGSIATKRLGNYVLESLLGQGGMGQVWRARHMSLGRPAAVKIIKVDALSGGSTSGGSTDSNSDNAIKRFEREARATAALQSSRTISLYDYGRGDDGTVYYAMELLDGLDLRQLVERFGPLRPSRVIHVLSQVCDSLGEAHDHGLLHRDVKPANVFLCKRGSEFDAVKVLDFGIVRLNDSSPAASRLTAAQTFVGSPVTIAPEVVLGAADLDHRADLYAVGCVGYWLLTGHDVFESGDPMGMAMAHAAVAPPPPLRARGGPHPGGSRGPDHGLSRQSPRRPARERGSPQSAPALLCIDK